MKEWQKRKKLNCERRFLHLAFENFCSGCFDALLAAVISVSGGRVSSQCLAPPLKEGKRQPRTSAPLFLYLEFFN